MKMPPLLRIGFTLGVKASLDASSVPPQAMLHALNVRSDLSGILRVRGGYASIGGPLDQPTVTQDIQGGISAFGKILSVQNRNVYLHDMTDGAVTQIGTDTGASATGHINMIPWARGGAEIAYIFSGAGIYQTTGGAVTAITPYTPATGEQANLIRNSDGTLNFNSGPCRCQFAILKASLSQRMVAAGDPLSPNTVYLSAPLDATWWQADQIIQLPDDGGKITGLVNWYNAVIIFRDKDIWAFFGSSVDASASLVLQENAIGCIQGETIAFVPGLGITFAGPDNIYVMQGVSAIENQVKAVPFGMDVLPFYKKAVTYGLGGVCAVYYDLEYRLSFPGCIQDERVFVLSLKGGSPAWYMDSGPLARSFVVDTHNNQLYAAAANRWVRYDPTRLNDDGANIPVQLAFRREDLQPGPSRIKRIFLYALSKGRIKDTDLFFMGSSFNQRKINEEDVDPVSVAIGTVQHLKVSVVSDGSLYHIDDFNVTVGLVSFADLANIEPVRVYEARFSPSLKGNFVQIKITGLSPEEDYAILGYGIEYSNRGRIHGSKVSR